MADDNVHVVNFQQREGRFKAGSPPPADEALPQGPSEAERKHMLMIPTAALAKIIEMSVVNGFMARNKMAVDTKCPHCKKTSDHSIVMVDEHVLPLAEQVFEAVISRMRPGDGSDRPTMQRGAPILYGPDGVTPIARG